MMKLNARRSTLAALIALGLGTITECSQQACAGSIFVESFDNPSPPDGRILFDADPIYDGIPGPLTGGNAIGNLFEDGRIVQSDGAEIPVDQSGSGYFLLNRTGGGGGPFRGEIWGTSSPISVSPGRTYEFSFFLTNENSINNAIIQPKINGLDVGTPVSADGTYLTNGWQQFVVSWNSGAETTADLSLFNVIATNDGGGIDFGIDTIGLSSTSVVPEPSTWRFMVAGFCGVLAIVRRRRWRDNSGGRQSY